MFRHLLTLAAAACITIGANAATLFESYNENGALIDRGNSYVTLSGDKVEETLVQGQYPPPEVEEYVGHATTFQDYGASNIAPAEDILIQVYRDNKIRVNAWAGVEGYDIIVARDDDWHITTITPVCNGVEGESIGNDWVIINTGNGDEIFRAYIFDNYAMVSDDGIMIQGYIGEDYRYYYIKWPLTAEQLTNAIMGAYNADIAQIQECIEFLTRLQEEYAGYGATESGAETLSRIAQAIQKKNDAVAAALETAIKAWGYESPLNGSISDITSMLWGAVAECEDFIAAIDAAAQTDNDILEEYVEEIETFMGGDDFTDDAPAVAAALYEQILALQVAIEEAGNKALHETGIYVSPLTEEAIAELDSLLNNLKNCGINGINADSENTIYFDLNGMQTASPAPGRMAIKIVNDTATKVYIK